MRRILYGGAGAVFLVALSLFWPVDLTAARLSPSLLASDGTLLRSYLAPDGQVRLPLTTAGVDPLFFTMLTGYEDRRFRLHPGVDPLALLRAAGQLAKGGEIVSGGSTLTMQVARLLSPAPRTVSAKLREIWRAVRLEAQYSKDDILDLYLVLAPYGGNLSGLRAASLSYFDKEPSRLTPDEAALLVVIPQNPNAFRPDRFPAAARAARDKVLTRLHDQKLLTDTAFAAGIASPVPKTRFRLPFHASHLADRLIKDKTLNAPWRSTIDAPLQTALEDLLREQLKTLPPQASIAAIVIDNRTHELCAYIGNADYFSSARAGQVDLIRAMRSPGSTLKPFLYGMAFQDGIAQPETIIRDAPMRFGAYVPNNFNQGFQGDVSMREALQQSLNIPAVKVINKVGSERFLAKLRAAGAKFDLPPGAVSADLPIILGSLGTRLWDLSMLYSGLANDGKIYPTIVLKGDEKPDGHVLLNKTAAWQVTSILTGSALSDGIIRGPDLESLAVKTGTSYGYRDAWAMGYTPRYTVGIWTGRADGSPSPGQTGRNAAIPLLLRAYDLIPQGTDKWRAPPRGAVTAYGDLPVNLQRWSGDRATSVHGDAAASSSLSISFPPENAVFKFSEISGRLLKFNARGGARPYQWYINGVPVSRTEPDGAILWTCPGEGRYKLTVQDSVGATTTGFMRIVR